MTRLFHKEEGQGLAAYGLIVALIAVVAVFSTSALSDGIKNILNPAAALIDIAGSQEDAFSTPLGSTFEEITANMIALIKQKFQNSGSYGRTWGNYAYTDLGLDPDDWDKAVDHIIYKPSGSSLRIRPEDGYSFTFTTADGTTKTITSSYHWDLIYSETTQKGYYHSVSANNEIDINTLTTTKTN